jgi:RNA-directed DNA polymerase
MRRFGGLWQEVISSENLYAAFCAARRGKRGRDEVAVFCLNEEPELMRLRQELKDRSYEPGTPRQFVIYERKARLISAAPFRDRIVHHALMRVVEPLLDRRYYGHSYACRVGKGVHAAVRTYQSWAGRHPYVIKLDIRKYFPSVDRALLLAEIARYIKDEGCLWLFERIINRAPPTAGPGPLFPGDDLLTVLDRPRGLPIGNLTSQILANLFLNRLDHWIAAHHEGGYLRYVDDMIAVGHSKQELWDLRDAVAGRLADLRLQLHPTKAHVMRTDRKVDVLGYYAVPGRRWVRGENVRRAARRIKTLQRDYTQGRVSLDAAMQSLRSWIGHAMHAQTEGLRERLIGQVVWRAPGESAPSQDIPPWVL